MIVWDRSSQAAAVNSSPSVSACRTLASDRLTGLVTETAHTLTHSSQLRVPTREDMAVSPPNRANSLRSPQRSSGVIGFQLWSRGINRSLVAIS